MYSSDIQASAVIQTQLTSNAQVVKIISAINCVTKKLKSKKKIPSLSFLLYKQKISKTLVFSTVGLTSFFFQFYPGKTVLILWFRLLDFFVKSNKISHKKKLLLIYKREMNIRRLSFCYGIQWPRDSQQPRIYSVQQSWQPCLDEITINLYTGTID